MKIDFEKTYNKVRCDFLEEVMVSKKNPQQVGRDGDEHSQRLKGGKVYAPAYHPAGAKLANNTVGGITIT